MRSVNALTALSVLASVQAVGACPFHLQQEEHQASYDNQRRHPVGTSTRTAIHHVRVYDGWHFSIPQTLCLDSGYIVDIGRCAEARTIVDGTGKFLIPGLIDNHLHLRDVSSLETFTSYGCTTAFHANCRNYSQCAINTAQSGLASFLYAGNAAVGNGSAHSKSDPTQPKGALIYPDSNVTQFVEWQFHNGSDFHKITAEVDGPSLAQQIEMVRTAHVDFGRTTFTHASAISAYVQAADSLPDHIQHVPDDGLLSGALIKKIKKQNQSVTPTLNVFEYAYRDALLQQYLGVVPRSNRTLAHAEANAKLLYEAGIPILAGTDSVGVLSFNGSSTSIPWGLTLHYELENLVNIVGMSPAEAINAATIEAATWHRIPDRGSIEVGKRADLVLLNSDPLVNISNTQDIDKIWVGGIQVAHVTKLN